MARLTAKEIKVKKNKFLKMIESGKTTSIAASIAGISNSTARKWRSDVEAVALAPKVTVAKVAPTDKIDLIFTSTKFVDHEKMAMIKALVGVWGRV